MIADLEWLGIVFDEQIKCEPPPPSKWPCVRDNRSYNRDLCDPSRCIDPPERCRARFAEPTEENTERRECVKCGKPKLLKQFSYTKRDGYSNTCRVCYNREHSQWHRDRTLQGKNGGKK